ncbi:DNA cytosine methyltransferase [uncultured Xanthomonas sp.]|uniref:DNA cytosine methyltransferase n=1 Tax=uncultured Xanthomonas sp. TaxID=152831 RepID=UPI0025F64766|nr:DNA cytosine methyltransferase [uncultured Xanthomonas sp.]
MRSVELFAGAGGLAIGMGNAGFDHAAVLEWDHDACETLRINQRHGVAAVDRWPIHEGDARVFDYSSLRNVEVVSGGPPCQPFSLGGKHQGHQDGRDMFPEAVRAVRELQPKAFIFENVKGLLRRSFATYLQYVLLQLTYPELKKKGDEDWRKHLTRLERHQTANANSKASGLAYNLVFELVNAADYGVPQKRERFIIVGFRSDLGVRWAFPEHSHSCDALLRDQWISGDYWERHKVAKRARPALAPRLASRIERLRGEAPDLSMIQPWQTVRDAISDLPDPEKYPRNKILNHRFNPGARAYPGHTGSPLDEPAKTLKAGAHGVPGGENMLTRPDGSVRYFSVREAARLQTFPDNYEFFGAWSETMRQLGNAVPVKLGETIATSVASALKGKK